MQANNMPLQQSLVIHMLRFPKYSFSMAPHWFKVNITVIELRLEKIAATEIMDNAFNSEQFHATEKLEIFNSPIRVLKEGTFNGLTSLRILLLDQVKILEFGRYVLAPIYKYLTNLTVCNCGPHKLDIENLTGTVELPQLKKLNIEMCNLDDTIGNLTFWGLTNVTEMHLGHNGITEIAANAFRVPFETLEYLYLGNNQLKTLPLDIFNTNRSLTINPSQNPWHCGCECDKFREYLRNSMGKINFGRFICKTPDYLTGWVLNSAPNLCWTTGEMVEIQKIPILPVSLKVNQANEDNSFIEMIEKLAEDAILKNKTNQYNEIQSVNDNNDDGMIIFMSAIYMNTADVAGSSFSCVFGLFVFYAKFYFDF